MNINRPIKAALLALVGLGLASSVSLAQQTNVLIDPKGTDTGGCATGNQINVTFGPAYWQNWFINNPGITNYTICWDTNNPPPTGDMNGSVEQIQAWDGTSGGTLATFCCVDHNFWGGSTSGGTAVDMTKFTQVEMDFKYDTNSTILPTNRAQFDVMVDNARGSSTGITLTNIGNSGTNASKFDGAWHHLVVPIPQTLTGVGNSKGPGFHIFNPGGTSGSFNYWVANITLIARVVPVPPPTLKTPYVATTGFNAIAAGNGQYDRCHIITAADTGYSFFGNPCTTYSWTIKSFPTGTGGNFQQHFFIVNGAPGQFDSACDYNFAQCLFLTVQQNDAGVATFNFRYKTNEPGNSTTGGNGMIFNTLALTNPANTNGWPPMPIANLVASNGAVGTWSVTFCNNTNVTVTGPGGVMTNFVFDAASAALFADPVTLCLGGQPNNPNGFGKSVIFSSFSATGCANPFTNQFDTDLVLNTNLWKNLAGSTNEVVLVPATPKTYWVPWTLPANSFSLQAAASLPSGGVWTDLSSAGTINDNSGVQALVPVTSLPGTNSNFFSLIKRTFTQLQVILPGETAAPGTLTGKTGTPTAQNTTVAMTFTVNAVDANWFPIAGVTDTVGITSSDGAAILPNNTALVNGTMTFQILFQTGGGVTNTVTATDITDGGKTPNTSSGVVVN